MEAIEGLRWWHRIEVAPGVVTPGPWDLRPTAERMPWPGPGSLEGLRCLDVGTMDGFWAFEMERRGAAEVVAIDLVDPQDQDSAATAEDTADDPDTQRQPTPPEWLRGETFRTAAKLLGSTATYHDLNVYDLDPDHVGRFDLVVMGYVLQMLRDPLRGLEAVRRVCRGRGRSPGHLIVLDTVSRPLSLLPSPIARLDARRDGSEWFVFNRRGLQKSLTLAGFRVEATTRILRDHYGPRPRNEPRRPVATAHAWALHTLGLRGRSVAVRARSAHLARDG